eukprot:6076126-Pleurochrysis_carterae.AAC.7
MPEGGASSSSRLKVRHHKVRGALTRLALLEELQGGLDDRLHRAVPCICAGLLGHDAVRLGHGCVCTHSRLLTLSRVAWFLQQRLDGARDSVDQGLCECLILRDGPLEGAPAQSGVPRLVARDRRECTSHGGVGRLSQSEQSLNLRVRSNQCN